jgi:hypothetical protein
VARGPLAVGSYASVFEQGLDAAQKALDLLAIRTGTALVVEEADSHHIAWWTEPRGLVLRVVTIADFGVTFSATAIVSDAGGNIVPAAPTSALPWHPSFRYFRLSQTASDLFDSYRNMYLALESLLSAVVPQSPKASGGIESEGKWLRRALRTLNTSLPLAPYAPANSGDPVASIFDDLYTRTRTAVFHAKSGRPYLLPQGRQSRPQVVESLDRLGRLYLDLAAFHLSARRPSSGLTYAGFDLATQFSADVVVSADDAPVSREDAMINPTGGAVWRLSTRKAPELSSQGLKFWLGEGDAKQVVADVSPIRRIGLTGDQGLMLVDRLDEPLSLDGVDVFQGQVGVRLVNRQQRRFRFRT